MREAAVELQTKVKATRISFRLRKSSWQPISLLVLELVFTLLLLLLLFVCAIRLSLDRLVLLSLFALALQGVHADLFIVLFEGRHILAGLGELSLLHALADVPENGAIC